MPKKELFMIIDANSIFHRAYHALPRLTTPRGELVNAVYGFSLVLTKVLREFKPDYMAAAFDVAGPTFREKEYKEYKAGRVKAPDDLYAQIPLIKDVLKVLNIPIYERAGFEADDVIGTIVKKLTKYGKDMKILIVSGDMDIAQLITKNVELYTMKRGVSDTIIYNEKAVRERFGFGPEFVIDYKGLRGDPSDNIPGVPGVGDKMATQLITTYGNLEGIYAALDKDRVEVSGRIKNILKENREQAFFSRKLALIRTDVPIKFSLKDSRWGGFNHDEVAAFLNKLGFTTLARRLAEVKGLESIGAAYDVEDDTSRKTQLVRDIEEARNAGILSDKLYKVEKDLVPIIVDMEKCGIGLDIKVLNKLQKKVATRLKGIQVRIYKEAGREFNVNSPKQLSQILFEELRIDTKGIKKTKTGNISTAAGELEKLKGRHKIADFILEQRELQKLLSTYIVPLPKLVDDNGRLHTTFRPLGTTTGRLSSSNPNLQNIPMRGEFAKDMRNAFVPATGKKFFSCDYSQMELRIIAHLSEDKNMINTFLRGEDIHVNTAAFVFGVEVNKVTSQMRYRAKALNFGIIYGIGPRAFAQSAGTSYEEAREFIQRYLDVYEGVGEYMRRTKDTAHANGYVETLFGRKRFLPDLSSPNPMIRAMAERAAINMPVQGTAADIVKMAMVASSRAFGELTLLLQVHDELLWEGDPAIIEDKAGGVQKLLEDIVKLSVPLVVDYKIGDSWGSLAGPTP